LSVKPRRGGAGRHCHTTGEQPARAAAGDPSRACAHEAGTHKLAGMESIASRASPALVGKVWHVDKRPLLGVGALVHLFARRVDK